MNKRPLSREIMRRLQGAVPVESLSGEHKLMLAVIGQAVEDFILIRPTFIDRDGCERNRPEHFSAERFLFDPENWVADALGLNTEFIHRVIHECATVWGRHGRD